MPLNLLDSRSLLNSSLAMTLSLLYPRHSQALLNMARSPTRLVPAATTAQAPVLQPSVFSAHWRPLSLCQLSFPPFLRTVYHFCVVWEKFFWGYSRELTSQMPTVGSRHLWEDRHHADRHLHVAVTKRPYNRGDGSVREKAEWDS